MKKVRDGEEKEKEKKRKKENNDEISGPLTSLLDGLQKVDQLQ